MVSQWLVSFCLRHTVNTTSVGDFKSKETTTHNAPVLKSIMFTSIPSYFGNQLSAMQKLWSSYFEQAPVAASTHSESQNNQLVQCLSPTAAAVHTSKGADDIYSVVHNPVFEAGIDEASSGRVIDTVSTSCR